MKVGQVLDWDTEKTWVNEAWFGSKSSEDALEDVQKCLQKSAFALNLFDRASQQHSPGAIANTFREILSVDVVVFSEAEPRSEEYILERLDSVYDIDSSSTSLKTAYRLLGQAKRQAKVVRYRDELTVEQDPSYLAPGDLLLLPSSVAYLHRAKGLCFGDASKVKDAILASEFIRRRGAPRPNSINSQCQALWKHTEGVMRRTREKLLHSGHYRSALKAVLSHLEPEKDPETLADVIGYLAELATGFHDLGKCSRRWQERARAIDPGCTAEELIGRTGKTARKFGIPHTPPGFFAAVAACKTALGELPESDHLVRAIALAAARHHSSLLNPSAVRGYQFDPVEASVPFVGQVLRQVGLNADPMCILEAARSGGGAADIPLMLPNDDLFPIYALVGRAILISDREDAAGQSLECWNSDPHA